MEKNLPITGLGRVLRLDSCRRQKAFKTVEESGTDGASRKFESALYCLEQALYRKLGSGAYRYHDIEYILGEVRRMWNAQRDDAGRSAVLAKIQDPDAFIKYWKGVDEGVVPESKMQILYWAHMLDEAFVEGGAPTCQAVSDMAPDELYEGRR